MGGYGYICPENGIPGVTGVGRVRRKDGDRVRRTNKMTTHADSMSIINALKTALVTGMWFRIYRHGSGRDSDAFCFCFVGFLVQFVE